MKIYLQTTKRLTNLGKRVMNIVLLHSEFNISGQRINIFQVTIVLAFGNNDYDIIRTIIPIDYSGVRSTNHKLFLI